MTAALYDEVVAHEVVSIAPVRKLRVVRDTDRAPAPKKAPQGIGNLFFGAGDPLVDGAARLLTVPVRHVYAALWRAGILEVHA